MTTDYEREAYGTTRQNLSNKVNNSVNATPPGVGSLDAAAASAQQSISAARARVATIGFGNGQVDPALARAAAAAEGVTDPDTWIEGIGWGSTPAANINVGGIPTNNATTSPLSAGQQGASRFVNAFDQFSYTGSNPLQPNPLEEYASFNNIFTLGVLTPEQINFPDRTYRQNGSDAIILRSGGGAGSKKVTTAFESQGKVEYFIDNLDIDSIITPRRSIGSTNATTITFEVMEPYSMGLFLQSLMEGALQAGYANYINASYLLQIDFVGYDDEGNAKKIDGTTRYYPIKFVDIKFNVTGGGCTYQCQAIPYNEQAFSDVVQQIKTDVAPTGATVYELLQTGENSLTSIINRRARERASAGEISTPDEVVIIFPNADLKLSSAIATPGTNSATVSPEDAARSIGQVSLSGAANIDKISDLQQNKSTGAGSGSIAEKLVSISSRSSNVIANSQIVKSILDRGISPMGIDAFVIDEETGNYSRGKISISPDLRQFTFGQGMKIQNIIESVILTSDYARSIADYNVDTVGMVDWFRIETDVYINQDLANEARQGRPGLVYVYKVMQYKVHSSIFNRSSTGGANYANLQQKIAKEYNYIYTGKNKDILNFDIDINFAFFTGLQDDRGQGSPDITQGGADSALPGDPAIYGQIDPSGEFQPDGQSTRENTIEPDTQTTPGTEIDDQKIRIARQFHDAIVNSDTDLIQLKLDIMGDPYFIADSGMGNYSSQNIGLLNINGDGGMEYQSSEVDILINFRTPIDYKDDDTGGMLFPEDTVKLTPFSGLYRVIFVRNTWQQNKFVQQLTLIRRPYQEKEGTVTDQRLFTETSTSIGDLNLIPPAEIIQQATASLARLETTIAGYAAGMVDPRLLQAAKQLELGKINLAQQAQTLITTNKERVQSSLSDLARGIRRGF